MQDRDLRDLEMLQGHFGGAQAKIVRQHLSKTLNNKVIRNDYQLSKKYLKSKKKALELFGIYFVYLKNPIF